MNGLLRTQGEEAYLILRADIIAGRLLPDQKLPFRKLSDHYDIGVAALREGLMRLASEQLVVFHGQRGFIVAPISKAEMHDLVSLRIELSCKALRLAIEKGDFAWEDEIVLSLRNLNRSARPASGDDATKFDEWEQRHDRFHKALIAACGSPWLLRFCSTLGDQFQRYRRLVMRHVAGSNGLWTELRSSHATIAEATLARNADVAVQLLQAHFQGSVDTVSQLYPETNSGQIRVSVSLPEARSVSASS